MKRRWLLALCALLLGLPGTARATENFRARISSQIGTETSMDDVKAEISFGRDVAARILGTLPQLRDEELTRYLNLVGKGVAAYSDRSDLEFHFAVLDSEAVNAFAAPGGYIFITRGALLLMQDEAELAGVLAHEISHVTARHIVNELGIRATDSAGTSLATLVTGATDPLRVALQQMVDRAVEILFERGYQKQDEFESDRLGTMLLAMSGYDPGALRRYLERMAAQKSPALADISRTHPGASDRIAAIGGYLTENGLTASAPTPIDKERLQRYVRIH